MVRFLVLVLLTSLIQYPLSAITILSTTALFGIVFPSFVNIVECFDSGYGFNCGSSFDGSVTPDFATKLTNWGLIIY